MKYKLCILTPLHIGTGKTIFPIEYLLENKFYRIDMAGLFKGPHFDNNKFIQQSMKEPLYLGDFAPEPARRHIRYELKVSSHCRNMLLSRKNKVREFVKSNDLPYIPGSSLKGALRTVVLWSRLKNPSGKIDKAIRRLTFNKKNPRGVDDRLERLVFGKDPKYDIFKVLHIGDTFPKDIEDLEVYEVRTLTTTRNGHNWKRFTTFIEGLQPKVKYEGSLKIDEWLFTSPNWGFMDKQKFIKNLPYYCNQFAESLIRREKEFYQKYNNPSELEEIIDEYNLLEDELKRCGKNEFLLHFAWGTGWHSMTVGRILQQYPNFDFLKLRETYALGKRKNKPYFLGEFPKTRKIIFEDGKPKYPLGWTKIKWEE